MKFKDFIKDKSKLSMCSQPWTVTSRDMDGMEGLCNPIKCEIHLDHGGAEERRCEVLLHEIFHALMDYSGLSNRMDEDVQEEVIRSLSPLMYDTFRRNKISFDYGEKK